MVKLLFIILFSSLAFADLQYLAKSIGPQTSFESVSTNFYADTYTSGVEYDDAVDEDVEIGFAFPFNGTMYSKVNIDSNGHLAFVDITSEYSNQELPRANREQSIYPYWDDLNVAKGGTIKYGTIGSGESQHFVVDWGGVSHYSDNNLKYSFQVVLYKDGSIRFRYYSGSSTDGSSATIGVQESSNFYDEHVFNSTTGFDATQDILYRPLVHLSPVTPQCSAPQSKLEMSTYDTSGYGTYPNNEYAFKNLVQAYATDARWFGSGYLSQINGSGNPYGSNNNYLTIFEGYIYLASSGIYQFGVDGDDAVEVYLDDKLITGWYGGHGRHNHAEYSIDVAVQSGWHKVEFHQQEKGGGDNYYLYWQQPNGSIEIVPSSQLFHCEDEAKMAISKSSCILSDLVNGTSNPKRIPGATIRYALEVSNTGELDAEDVLVNDSISSEFDETTIKNLQIQDGACDCLGVASASNNGANGTANGENPIALDFGTVASKTVECGYFEADLK